VRAAWWHEQQDEVVDSKMKMEIGGGYTEFAGFPVVHQKTTGFLG
jgi:hypothetical protein